MKRPIIFALLISIFLFAGPDANNACGEDQPLFLFYSKDTTLSTAFMEAFQKKGMRVIADSDLKQAKKKYMKQLRDKGGQEHVLEALEEKYGDEELSMGDMGASELKVASALASALSADYTVVLKYKYSDKGKDDDMGMNVVELVVEELKVGNSSGLGSLAVLTGSKTGIGSSAKKAKIQASGRVAKLLTAKIKKIMDEKEKQPGSVHIIISNVLDSKTSIKFSRILKGIVGTKVKRTYDSTQHSANYTFAYDGDKDDLMLNLMDEAETIDGVEELDIIDEQENLSRITIKAMIKAE